MYFNQDRPKVWLLPPRTKKQVSEQEQISHLGNDIDALVDRYRQEYDMSYASVVGVLEMKIFLLCSEASERSDEV